MVSSNQSGQTLIHSIKQSSVGPAEVTGSDLIYEPENIDLAMKLHYIRAVYYFKKEAFDGQETLVIKEPMFEWLNLYPMVSGRFRRVESGRPYVKCNDCGVRFLEGKCEKTLEEWLEIKDIDNHLERKLVPCQVLGPDLGFSPLLFIQLTKFKCGGTAVGLSWAHVLGDAFCAGAFMNMLGQAVAGKDLGQPITLAQTHTKSIHDPNANPPKPTHDPISIKRVESAGDHWVVPSVDSNMEAFSFHVTPAQLKQHLQPKFKREFTTFETISAFLWQIIARIRGEDEPKVVTICKAGEKNPPTHAFLSNSQVVSVVSAPHDLSIVESNLNDLAASIKNEASDERAKIEEAMERENGLADFFVYSANLTFVNLIEGAKFYEFDYRGQKPVDVSYWIDGIGEEGTVLMLQGPNGESNITAILPKEEIEKFKSEITKEGLIMV